MLLTEERRKLREDTVGHIIKMIRSDYEKNGLATTAVDLLENYIGIQERYIGIQERYIRTLEDAFAEGEESK